MRIRIFFLTLLLACMPALLPAQELPFGDAETVQYTVHYKYGVSADLASVTVEGRKQGADYHVTAHLNTFRFWDSFFKMRDKYESTFAMKPGLKPRSAMRDVSEGNYWVKCNYTWGDDPTRVHAIIDKRNRPHRDTVLKEDGTIRDVFNMIYYCRTADFDKLANGGKIRGIVAMDRTIYKVTLRQVGREKKKVDGKTWNTVKLAISMTVQGEVLGEGNTTVSLGDTAADFSGGEKMWFWVSDDDNRLPVFFSANLKVGAVQGRMTQLSGNKYPLTALID